jgi:hypothetical protein
MRLEGLLKITWRFAVLLGGTYVIVACVIEWIRHRDIVACP